MANSKGTPSSGRSNLITPPSSPKHSKSSSNLCDNDLGPLENLRSSLDTHRAVSHTEDNIIICPFEVEYIKDHNGQNQIFGYGAWSTVFKGTCHRNTIASYGLLTPPSSPKPSPPILVAVKAPARKDAPLILRSEAQALSRLMSLDLNEERVATFHGILDRESSLVLAAHPLSLESYIKSHAQIARTSLVRENISSPVIGSSAIWLDLAHKLISTLEWLHNEAMTVHGDLKPGNVLLKPTTGLGSFSYHPLLIDFSSSQNLATEEITKNTLSAITLEYTAPELLSVRVLNDPKSTATTASDVFSMAVTLLVAATGETLVYPKEYQAFQRRHFAQSGHMILNNVRSFSMRVPRQGVVSRVLEKAVLKHDMGRISTSAWKQLVEDLLKDTKGELAKM
ncbi:hypothetical protein H2198_002959 [Neophaeococcomyces mojaviensis]|uniref:Uncharacterized protein n=1 Tax=Neophaeococcomyces mojaviensis TaxID=3383035 RepID=A0ACC3ADJ8_9EURO|nr:hypothetical protein H2198_002959 [Knufia sp. JES_112]